MAKLYERNNYDNIFNRSVIGGLLYLMNRQIKYTQVWENNVVEEVSVPCAYEMVSGGDERFVQDYYTFFGRECFSDKMIDGKFDMLPRCAIKYTGSTINSNDITNRFVKGKYMKDENGKLVTYEAFLYSIPVTMNFECEVWLDTIDTAFKVEQSIRETFYKNRTFNVLYRGMKIGCTAGFPEQTNFQKTTEYKFDSERNLKMTFNIAVETYQPVFDDSTSIDAGTRIEYIGVDVNAYNSHLVPENRQVTLKFNPIDTNITYVSGSNLYLSWISDSITSDVLTVSLSYIDENGKETQIATPMYNQNEYLWHIPLNLSAIKQPKITFIDENITIEKPPVIKIVPNKETGYIDEQSFVIVDGGLFNKYTGSAQAIIEYYTDDKKLHFSKNYYFNINGRTIDRNVPVTIIGDKLLYENQYIPNKISIKLSYTIDMSVYDIIDNVLII